MPRNLPAALVVWLFAFVLLITPGCGGRGDAGDGDGGGGGGGGGVGGNPATPFGEFIAPVLGAAGMLGDTIQVTFTSESELVATVRLVADADRDLDTPDDQVVLFSGTDTDGAEQTASILLAPPLTPGAHTLALQVDDGVNPIFETSLLLPLTVYRGVAGVAPPRSNRYGVARGVVVFSRGETEDAAGPLNGDGDSIDGVMVAIDVNTGAITQPSPSPSMDVAPLAGGVARVIPSEGGTLAWFTNEAEEGVNLNGTNVQNPTPPIGGADTDQVDTMVSYIVPATSMAPRTNTYGGATQIVGRAGGRIVLSIAEAGEGTGIGLGTDLTFDADAADAMLAYLDPAAAPPLEFNQLVFFRIPVAAAAGPAFRGSGTSASAYLATEVGSAAGADFNGDGDGFDTFLVIGDVEAAGGTGLPANMHTLAGTAPGVASMPVDPTAAFDISADRHVGYYADEGSQNAAPGGAAGTDLNLDGIFGFVPTFYDTATNTQTVPAGGAGALNSPAGATTMIYDQTRLFFTAQEAPRIDPMPGTNGDADGGLDTAILYWTDHAIVPPVAWPVPIAFGGALPLQALSLDMGGSATKLTPGWIALLVNEAANGNQDINGSGAVDMAYLLLQTGPGAAPTVHNPGLVPSTAGTFPLTGLYVESPTTGEDGVVVRLTEAANGVLDGDGDFTETFLAYISFLRPSIVRILDVGGDHCAIGGSLIAVTANEALTGVDYDGNGTATDHVFRVLDVTGKVYEKGRLCSALSAPATERGEIFAYLRDEDIEKRDMNGDSDQTDLILGIWVP